MTTATREFTSRPRESERTTRRPLAWWDRIKFLLLIAGVFGFFAMYEMADNPLLPASEAFRITFENKWWLVVLFGVECLRQLHYLVCERSVAYYAFWNRRFRGVNERLGRLDPWTRYRLARAIKIVIAVVVIDLVVARIFETSAWRAPFELLSWMWDQIPAAFQVVAFLTFWIGFQFGLIIWFATRGGIESYFPDDIETRFSDVWGQDPVLTKVRENVMYLEHPEEIEERGGYVPGGILLWGPPGTGKTLMAEAIAGETGRPFVNIDAGMLNTMGMGVLKVKFLFRRLRRYALKYGGVVAFFDEADALGSRGNMSSLGGEFAHRFTSSPFHEGHSCGMLGYVSDAGRRLWAANNLTPEEPAEPAPSARRNRFIMGMGGAGGAGGGVLQALLAEMSGLKRPRGFVNRTIRRALGMKPKPPPKYRMLTIMATNMPESLDPAMLRPGRIDRIYRVGYPSMSGRLRTYQGYLAKVDHDLTQEQVEKLALMTPYSTGALIKDLVNEALISAIRDDRKTISWADVLHARQMQRLGPTRDVELVSQDRHGVAVHEACHALVSYRVRNRLEIDIATIEPGNDYLGMVSSIRVEDRFKEFKSEFEADIMVCLASLAGERQFFDGDSASGVSGDLQQATETAIYMEGYWGMGDTLMSHGVSKYLGIGGGIPGKKKSDTAEDRLRGQIGSRVEANLGRLYRHVEHTLQREAQMVLNLAHALEVHRTIGGDDVRAVIQYEQGPTVDGRIYADAEFQRRIAEYHDAMLAAHRAGEQRVDIPVPLPDRVVGLDGIIDEELAELPLVVGGANGNGHEPAEADDPDDPEGGSYPRRVL